VIIFKLYDKFGVNNLPAIIINYFTCYITATLYTGTIPTNQNTLNEAWFIPAIFLSAVFILIFYLTAVCIQQLGMAKTIVYQKMSLIAPAILGLCFFGEFISFEKVTGIILAILAVYALSGLNPDKSSGKFFNSKYEAFGILVFLGSCCIDGTLYLLETTDTVTNADVNFVAHLFLFAGILGSLFLAFKYINGTKIPIRIKDVLGGIALGVPNFFTIYLIFRILNSGFDGSSFFPIQNVGILALATLTGILIFNEKLTRLNKMGLFLAFLTIILLSQ